MRHTDGVALARKGTPGLLHHLNGLCHGRLGGRGALRRRDGDSQNRRSCLHACRHAAPTAADMRNHTGTRGKPPSPQVVLPYCVGGDASGRAGVSYRLFLLAPTSSFAGPRGWRRREYALGKALRAQRRARQRCRIARGNRRIRHPDRMAGSDRRCDHGHALPGSRLEDRASGEGRAAHRIVAGGFPGIVVVLWGRPVRSASASGLRMRPTSSIFR